ncbi:MAG: hypothetical protein ACI4R9_04090 [Kiritimatiellia bacterium]
MKNLGLAVTAAVMLLGCVEVPKPERLRLEPNSEPIAKPIPRGEARYVEQGEVISGRASEATMYDLESGTQELLKKMRKSNLFQQNYRKVKAAKNGDLPVIVLGNIENKTSSRIQERLDSVRDIVRTSLFETDLFEVKDDQAAAQIAARIVQSETGGLENGAAINALGTHDSPDFMVLGDLRAFEDHGGFHTYKLRLAVHNLATGKIVWEGIQTKIKL